MKYIYLFPLDSMTSEDKRYMKKYNLEILGKNFFEGERNLVVRGELSNLKKYCSDYLAYEMHPDYLYKENEFAGDIRDSKTKDSKTNDSMKSFMFTSKKSGRKFVVKAKNTQDAITKFYNAVKTRDSLTYTEYIRKYHKPDNLDSYATWLIVEEGVGVKEAYRRAKSLYDSKKSPSKDSKVKDGVRELYKTINGFKIYRIIENGEPYYEIEYKGNSIVSCETNELSKELDNLKVTKKVYWILLEKNKERSRYESEQLAREELSRIQRDPYEKGWSLKKEEVEYVNGIEIK